MNRFLLALFVGLLALPSSAMDSPARPKIYSIAFVRFKAADFGKSKAFYEQVLDFRSGTGVCRGSSRPCYRVNELQHVELARTDSNHAGPLLEIIGLNVEDVEQMQEYVSYHGKTRSEISVGSNGLRSLQIFDPDGRQIVFVEQPIISSPDRINSPGQVSNRLIHAGFVVHDRGEMDRFYKGLLGFRPYWHGGMKDDKDDWVAMQVPDGTDWVEYMLNISPTADKHTLGVMNHIALGVTDIQATKQRLIKNGWKPGEEPKLGRDGKWQLNLYDPDDTRVEFMEFTPKENPCCSEFTGPHPGPKP